MRIDAEVAAALLLLASPAALDRAAAAPAVPGCTVEPYAAAAWPAWLSIDQDTGVLFAGIETGPPVRIWRIGAGGSPVDGYGATPILDPDAVLHDAAGRISEPGAVLVGGRSGGIPQILAVLPDPAQTVVGIFGPSSEWTNLSDMEFDSSGRLLIGDEDGQGGRVLATSSPGEMPVPLFVVSGRVAGLAIDAEDRIYTSTFDGRILVHAPDGSTIADPLLSGLGTRILPIAVGPGGPWGTDLYTVDQHAGLLIRADMQADTTVAGTGFDGFLIDFEFGPDGALYVSDLGLGRIWRIAPLTTAAGDEAPAGPRLRLHYANPARPPATIAYELPAAGQVMCRVYDVQGRCVRMLVHAEQPAGIHAAAWDGRDAGGRRVPAGFYVYRLDARYRGAGREVRTGPLTWLE